MGDAKRRGTQEQRIAAAVAKVEALRPDVIVCNECKAELRDIRRLDTRNMAGIEAAFAAHCELCASDTLALKGNTEAVASFIATMEEVTGEEGKMGMAAVGSSRPPATG